MTLIVAADAQDHLILAGDHCAVMSEVSNPGATETVLDNYRKVYPWKYGAVAASGDVFLATHFCRLFLHHKNRSRSVDLLHVAREAKQLRSRSGIPPDRSTGNIFFTLPADDGFALYSLSIRAKTIEFEIVRPIGTHFSMREEQAPDTSACQAFTDHLRPSSFFRQAEAFHRYHIDLLQTFFASQSSIDERVTPSFDAFFLEKRTGACTFWQSGAAKRLVSVALQAD